MAETDLRWVLWALGAIQSVLTLAVVAGVRALFSLSARIGEQNGRIQRLEQWKEDHVEEGDKRDARNTDAHKDLWGALNAIRLPGRDAG